MPKSTINWMHNIIRTMQAFSAEIENDTKPKKLFATYLIFCARLFIFALHWFRPSSLNAATSKMMHEKYIKHEEAQQKLAHTENQMEKLPSNLSRTINIYFFPVVFFFYCVCAVVVVAAATVAVIIVGSVLFVLCAVFSCFSNIRCTLIRRSNDGGALFILMSIFSHVVWFITLMVLVNMLTALDFAIVNESGFARKTNAKRSRVFNARWNEQRKNPTQPTPPPSPPHLLLMETLSTKSVLIFKNYYWQVVSVHCTKVRASVYSFSSIYVRAGRACVCVYVCMAL